MKKKKVVRKAVASKKVVASKKEVVVDVNRLRLSFSGADTYLRCGKQYQFRYVDGLKEPPKIVMIEGSSHHKSLEMNNLSKRDKGSDMHPTQLTDIFMDDFRTRIAKEQEEKKAKADWGGETEDSIFSRAKVLHLRYIQDIAPGIHPVEAERKFELPFTSNGVNVLLTGVCDLELDKAIFDYKTVSKSKGQNEVDNSLQLSLYSWATKKRVVGIIELLKTANPHVGLLQSVRTPQQVMWALQVVAEAARSIQAGVFPLSSPSAWNCSAKWCGYWSRCRGKSQ